MALVGLVACDRTKARGNDAPDAPFGAISAESTAVTTLPESVAQDHDDARGTERPAPETHTRPASTAVASSLAALERAPAPTQDDGPTVSFGPPQVSGGLLGDLEPTIRRMRAGIRACYARFVESEDDVPDASSLSLRFVVMSNGSVQSVRTLGSAGVAPGALDCMARRVQMTTFPLPAGEPAIVELPLQLRP